MTSKEQAQAWIDVMADTGAIGHYREKAVVAYLSRLLDRVKRTERRSIVTWLNDWEERSKGFTNDQADALGDAAEALKAGVDQSESVSK